MSDLLFEIGAEEIPAGCIGPALESLRSQMETLLAQARLSAESIRTAGTPRRLVLAASAVPETQPPTTERVIGPPARAAFDEEDNPTRAAEGFARSQGIAVKDLQVVENPEGKKKGVYAAAVVEHEGKDAADILPDLLKQATLAVGFPKSMRWPMPADQAAQRFVRPVRWLVALLGRRVLPVQMMGLQAGRTTFGHPFLAPEAIELQDASFNAYRDALRRSHVLVDPQERREVIRDQVGGLLTAHGATEMDAELLEEVTNLVEDPHAIEGSFDEAFMAVPDRIIVAAMTEHQRYFPVRDADGKLLARFITVSNRGPRAQDVVRRGNERVLRARLADARFFWDEDRKTGLEGRVRGLADVVYLGGLGDNSQRAERLVSLSREIAGMMGLADEQADHAARAAGLCKADLLTALVGEFPTLQGIVGRELALLEGEPEAVADAIADHYRPVGASDRAPTAPASVALALADKLDVIAGCFSLGLLPTGSQDPYALRRNALGVLLILTENDLRLDLGELVGVAAAALEAQGPKLSGKQLKMPAAQVMEFFRDRLYHAALEHGMSHEMVRAALATGFSEAPCGAPVKGNVPEFWKRMEALAACASQDWWPKLSELVDRTYRIQRDMTDPPALRNELLQDNEEVELARLLAAEREEITALFGQGFYVEGAELYCRRFADTVHEFFEQVFVNVDDAGVRANRKALCGQVYHLFADRFADLCASLDA